MAGSTPLLLNFISRIWSALGTPLRRYVTWLLHPKFVHGVAGVIFDDKERVLLLKHRFWKDQRWGLPGGLARHGETLAATLRRELREETGLDVRPLKLLKVSTSREWLGEFILLAEASGLPQARSAEIIEAQFWDLAHLPENLLPSHRELLGEILALRESPGLPLEP
jgi:ADP-ribose pyrophosphatase YjhB (NUDIX family)